MSALSASIAAMPATQAAAHVTDGRAGGGVAGAARGVVVNKGAGARANA